MLRKKEKLDVENLNEVISLSKRILRIGLTISIIALIVLVTYLLKAWHLFDFIKGFIAVISPVFIGLIIAWLFDPVVKFLEEKKIPRVVGCILIYIVIIGAISLFISLLMPSFISQVKDFISTIPELFNESKSLVNQVFDSLSVNSNFDFADIKKQIFARLEEFSISLTTGIPNALVSGIKGIFSAGVNVVLGLMIGFYMLYDFNKVSDAILNFIPRRWRGNASELGIRINQSLRGYVQGVLSIMFLVFITQSIGLTIAGLKAPLLFALFCALTDIIPYFGPYIGAIPAVIVGFSMSPLTGICCIISIVVVQLLENNFYQPLIMGHRMKLHPVTIMLGLLIFQHYFGIIGMIVATPVIASLKVILTFIDEKMNVIDKIKEV